MKISAKSQMNSQVKEKKNESKAETEDEVIEILQPKTLGAFTKIPLKKNKKDLLVAESDALSAIVIKAILDKHNFTFELVSTETEAIAAFEKNQFKIVLVGINEAHLFWDNLIKKVWEENNNVPKSFLLALTNPPTENSMGEYLHNNFDKIILRPYKETDLIRIIRKYKRLSPKRKTPLNKQSFSLDQLRRISNNNEEFVKNMLDKFVESAIECSETMHTALGEHDMDKMKKAAHKALPSYYVLELKELAVLLAYIEQHAMIEKELKEIENKLKDFTTMNQSIIIEIKKYLHIG